MANETTTPASAETEATTQAQAATEQPTQQPAATAEAPEVYRTQEQFEAAFRARLERERKQWQAEKEEIERRAKMDEAERIKAEKDDLAKQLEAEKARATRAERKAALAGKVADPEAALKLLDEDAHLGDDGTVNVEALLKSYPFLAPEAGRVEIPGARSSKKAQLTLEDVKRMTPDEINARWEEVQTVFKR